MADARLQIAARLYELKGKPPADMEPPNRWFLRNRITPLIPASEAKSASDVLPLQKEFLENKAEWKKR